MKLYNNGFYTVIVIMLLSFTDTSNTTGNVIIHIFLLHYNVLHFSSKAGRMPKPAAGAAGRTTICTPFGLPVLKCTPWTQPGGHPWS